VADFGQLTSYQLHELIFYPVASDTPCKRALSRLREAGLVTRIPHRIVGGAKGGSGSYVYVLTTNGRRLAGLEGRGRSGHVNYHALAIVDLVIRLKRMDRGGGMKIAGMKKEPYCHVTIAGYELKPDLYAELSRGGTWVKVNFEVDLGTEGPQRITEKIVRYGNARNSLDGDTVPYFPFVVWTTPDSERARELEYMLSQTPESGRDLHRITTLDNVGSLFGG
jgi:hypothetical protein